MRAIAFQHSTSASSQIFSDLNTLSLHDLADMPHKCKTTCIQNPIIQQVNCCLRRDNVQLQIIESLDS